jgi:hypothetical protein
MINARTRPVARTLCGGLLMAASACGTSEPAPSAPPGFDGGATDGTVPISRGAGFAAILIRDMASVRCETTSSPGADIDSIEVIEGNSITGVGLLGSAIYTAAAQPACAPEACSDKTCKYSSPDLASRVEGRRDATVNPAGVMDAGYLALNGGSVQLLIGDREGQGPPRRIPPGAKVRVYEVDLFYKQNGLTTPDCACPAEQYEVYALPASGSMDGAVRLVSPVFEPSNAPQCMDAMAGCGTTILSVP